MREVLPAALRLKSQPGGGLLNAEQQSAFSCFETCVRKAWVQATADAYDPAVVHNLASLINIITFDPDGSEREIALATLNDVAQESGGASGIISALETVCAELMAKRGGIDRLTLRRKLLGRGTALRPPRDFRSDIDRLKAHSEAIAEKLKRYETIEADGVLISIDRDCQDAIRDAAIGGSLLILGEPGIGKSAVVSALAREFRDEGNDVLELAVDSYSVETLEGLKNELRLEHGLLEILEAWDGTEPAWLVVDGLDASRGGHGAGVFRTLIEQVMALGGRWKVVASIRTFDLRMGQKFQELFKGKPPNEDLKEQEFPDVRHVRVPPWTQTEFAHLLERVPSLAAVMTHATRRLKDIALVPFNTRLLGDLVNDGLVTADLSHIGSQAELLQLYWKRRIEIRGSPARACILRVVKSMVEMHTLRAPFEVAAGEDASALDDLKGAGVLISVDNDRWIQCRHHLLFDFAVSKVLLDPAELIVGKTIFSKAEARGLMLAPALAFVLREIWKSDPSHAKFWTAATHILSDQMCDPVIRSAAGRICAELPERRDDTIVLAERIVAGNGDAAKAFSLMSGAFGIRLEDHPEAPLAPWLGFVRNVAQNVEPVQGALRFLLFRLVGLAKEQSALNDLGISARALLAHAFSLDGSSSLVSSAIDLVGDTFASDPHQSRALMENIFAPDRLHLYAAQEVPALCRKIDKIAPIDPEFGARIYRETFGFEMSGEQETNMSNSQILPLISNARQDFGMARYELKEYFETFPGSCPDHAVEAVVHAVETYVDRAHARGSDMLDAELQVDGRRVRLREDWSYIWAHDPEKNSGDEASALINKLLDHLRSADEAAAFHVAKRLVEASSLAVFWSRLFLAAAERRDGLLDFCLPIAMRQEFLTLADTSKDAVDVVAKGYERLSLFERGAFEVAVSRFDFSSFQNPDHARADLECRLFREIGGANLATDRARAVAKALGNDEEVSNDRVCEMRITSRTLEPYHWIQGADRRSPANRKLMDAIDRTERALGLKADFHNGSAVSLEDSLRELEALVANIDRANQEPSLVIHAEGQVSGCIARLVDRNQVPAVNDEAITARFLDLFHVAADSKRPVLHDDTEANFERTVAWGAPAPRVDAAKAAFELARQRPDLYCHLEQKIDELLQDPHPAVRLKAATYLVGIWDIDRAGFWRRLSARLADEPNAGVIDHVCAGVLERTVHEDAERTEQLTLALLSRFEHKPERQVRMRKSVSGLIAILWVKNEHQASHAVLEGWIADAATHVSELSKILVKLRMAFIAGLAGADGPDGVGLRHRSQAIAHKIVAAANAGLQSHFQIEKPPAEQEEVGRNCALLLDAVCLQLYFAAKEIRKDRNADDATGDRELAVFIEEVHDTLEAIGDFATPHTIHYLLKLCEFLLPVDPARAFDLAMHAIRAGGKLTGYQFESMGADLLVKLVGLFLADHDELFEEENRRRALIDCLEIFMEAGWPAAQRLLFRLPELIQ